MIPVEKNGIAQERWASTRLGSEWYRIKLFMKLTGIVWGSPMRFPGVRISSGCNCLQKAVRLCLFLPNRMQLVQTKKKLLRKALCKPLNLSRLANHWTGLPVNSPQSGDWMGKLWILTGRNWQNFIYFSLSKAFH